MPDDQTLRLVQKLEKDIANLQQLMKKQNEEMKRILLGGSGSAAVDFQTRLTKLEKDIQTIKSNLNK